MVSKSKNNAVADRTLLIVGFLVVAAVSFIVGVYYGQGSPKVPILTNTSGKVHLMIDYGNGTVSSYHFDLVNGVNTSNTTAYDLLVMASKTDGFKVEKKEYDFGILVTGINGVRGGDKPKHYWLYWVNAEMPDKASNLYVVSSGDVVEFKYGYVSWS